MKIIAGDIGGTKSWLALVESDNRGKMQLLHEQRYPSHQFENASSLLQHFVEDASTRTVDISLAMLALPGPVSSGTCQLTNLDWHVNNRQLEEFLSIQRVILINDFQAASAGIATLNQEDLCHLNHAEAAPQGTRVVTGAGTGLGLAWMQWQGGTYRTYATEGGHIDFAPTTVLQQELLQYILQKQPRVTYENLLSGRGLESLYGFILSRHESLPLDEGETITAANVSSLGEQGDHDAIAAIELFIEIYGSWVGNIALLYRPSGGLFITGGIAAKMVGWMQSDIFIKACYNKGKMSSLVKRTPVQLVTNERLGLQGAMAIALGHNT